LRTEITNSELQLRNITSPLPRKEFHSPL
jgi:hypothetical protein